MSASTIEINPEIIDCPLSPPDWSAWDARVRKIVLGKMGDEAAYALAALPTDFADRFPALTHLYLWGISGLKELPALPPGLLCLEVRKCQNVTRLPELPTGLESLVLEQCPRLTQTAPVPAAGFPVLDDLSLKACGTLPESWLLAVVAAAPALRKLDLSDCPQLTRIPAWPRALVDLRLNGCTGLAALPRRWTPRLRRLELRGATRVSELPDFPASLDYVDLGGTGSLRRLPSDWGKPRTLFLHGSGVLMPPASEHGASPAENVAARTRAYFEDVALTGEGEVKRCKLLILGNGSAGKTCLSLALAPGQDPRRAKELGSTHGIQFWDWDFEANTGAYMEPIHLHLWDFGGQEIYHNTHRLFMSKGAVFVVVWKPEQDGREPDPSECGYTDEWRPLRYWLDLIHDACPHKPRIAIVCSHRAEMTADLERRWREQAGPYAASLRCYPVDSETRQGSIGALTQWLQDEVGEVVATQGTAVPSYWEIAQDLVEGWVKRMGGDPAFAAEKNQMHPHRFREALHGAIEQAIASDRDGRLDRLRDAIAGGAFELTEDRLRRTLGFLTHSGWVYWDAKLHEERVIVGQKWALDGIYAVLDRRPKCAIYRELARTDGRFTLAQLGEWVWNEAGYSRVEQELFLSFIQRCGLCFQLRKGEEAWREEDVYVSFEHLPTAKEARLQRAFDSRLQDLNPEETTFAVRALHKHHWQAFLSSAGNHYGKNAQYALDGLYLENEEGEKLLILRHEDGGGLGGEIEIQVGGGKAAERLKAAEEHIRRFLPGAEDGRTASPETGLGKAREKEEIFISYAWDPAMADGGIPPGYEAPVDAIEAFLADKPVTLIRDKSVTKFGDNLKHFMEYGASRPHVIVVHSDKYWRSPFCVYELWTVMRELRKQEGRSLLGVVIPIEHQGSDITTEGGLAAFLQYWRDYPETSAPGMIEWTGAELKDQAPALLRDFSKDLAQHLNLNVWWSSGPEKVMAALAERLNLLPANPHA